MNLKWLLISVFSLSILGACNSNLPEVDPNGTVTTRAPLVADVSIAASKVAIRESDSSLLTATVTGRSGINTDVTWAIEAGGVGSLSGSSGNRIKYYAPSASFGRVVRITATSVQDPTIARTIFVSVNPIKASISGGARHTLALRNDGQVFSWGFNIHGQLGDGTNNDQPTPVRVQAKNDIVAISAGGTHSLALTSQGTVLSWGNNSGGQLGNGIFSYQSNIPVVVGGANDIIAISASGLHSLALKSDGTVIGWGQNNIGQLTSNANFPLQNSPIAIAGVNNIVSISAGGNHSLALRSDGIILSWGDNSMGQLGDGTTTGRYDPVEVYKTSGIIAISVGVYHSLALNSDGSVLTWGNNIGLIPEVVTGANNIVSIAAGFDDSVALKSDGTMLSWGFNAFGQLGNGTQIQAATPTPVSGASKVVAISAGFYHTLALRSNGTMLSWGSDSSGQLGNNAALVDQLSPVSVLLGTSRIRLP
jgi:alpha-tubulin suppressor-like RCC1 family protein